MRRRRFRLFVSFALVASAFGLYVTMAPAGADATIVSVGPLTSITTSSTVNCAVQHVGDSAGEWYGNTACGTFVAVQGKVYGPSSIPAGSNVTSSANYVPYTPVGQTGPTGTGTEADPYRLTTSVALGSSPFVMTQVDTYVVGQESYRTDVVVSSTAETAEVARVYRAGDCYLQDSDSGLGAVGATSVSCKALPTSAQPDRIEQFVAITPGHHYFEGSYSTGWGLVATGEDLPDTCLCDSAIDNGIAMNWTVTVPSGGSTTVSSLTSFSPLGAEPVSVEKTVTPGSVAPAGEVTYTIVARNPGNVAAVATQIIDHLPVGFSYVEGSTTGVTSADPTGTTGVITWNGTFAVPAQVGGIPGSITLSFRARASLEPGTYTNTASLSGSGLSAIPAVDVAPVVVTDDTSSTSSTSTSSTSTSSSSTSTSSTTSSTSTPQPTFTFPPPTFSIPPPNTSSTTAAPSTTATTSTTPSTTAPPTTAPPSTRPSTTRPATTVPATTVPEPPPAEPLPPVPTTDPNVVPGVDDTQPKDGEVRGTVPGSVDGGTPTTAGPGDDAGGTSTPSTGTTPGSSAPNGPDDRPTEIGADGVLVGGRLVVKGHLAVQDRCPTVAIEVEGERLGTAQPDADGDFTVEGETLGLDIGDHEATLVCVDSGREITSQPVFIVLPVGSASGSGSALGVGAFLMLVLLAAISIPAPIEQDE